MPVMVLATKRASDIVEVFRGLRDVKKHFPFGSDGLVNVVCLLVLRSSRRREV